MDESRFINKKDVNNFKELGINKILIDEFEKNEEKINMLELINLFKSKFSDSKIVNNIEIGRECIEKGLVITELDKCEFIIPLEAVDKIIEFKNSLDDNFVYKKPRNFLIIYPSKYFNLKDKEIPLEEIGVYYNPYFSFWLIDFSIELLEMKKKPKKVSMIKQANVLLTINKGSLAPITDAISLFINLFILFGLISALIFAVSNNIIASLVIFSLYFIIPICAFYKLVIEPFRNKEEILERKKEIGFIFYLRKAYDSSASNMSFIQKLIKKYR